MDTLVNQSPSEEYSFLQKELAAKNRELEIEAALERVRQVAMSLVKTDDLLNISKALFSELKLLGFDELRNAVINTFFDHKSTFLDYNYSDFSGGSITEIPYDSHPLLQKYVKQIQSSTNAFAETIVGYGEMESWKENGKKYGKSYDPQLDNISPVYYYCYSIGVSAIGISTFTSLTNEKRDILKKFRNVFDLGYRRYIDIANAEAQAREAKIQLALERVRARTMAMQHSDELKDVANLLFQQVHELGIPAWSCGFNIWEKDEKVCTGWMSTEGFLQPPFKIPLTESPTFIHFYESRQRGESFYSEQVSGQALTDHYNYMLALPDFAGIAATHFKAGFLLPTSQIHYVANFSHGNLIFITSKPLPDDAQDTFIRFAKVFEQTYTRFLDLQKAEAQAREAQIELGLERVRARAMAMRNSEELKELIGTVFIELTKLDLVLTRCLIMIYDPKTNDSTWWMANSETPSDPIGLKVQYHGHAPYLAYIKAWHEKQLKWTYPLEGEIKKQWDDFLFVETELSHLPDFVIAGMKAPGKVYLNASFNTFGNLTLATLEPLSNEHFGIMLRFAKVFDLTYTRFNDLQKAEAQAREAQIQLALERVHAKTMAMQKPSEFVDVINVIGEQFIHLGFDFDWVNFSANGLDVSKAIDIWNFVNVPGLYQGATRLVIPFIDHAVFRNAQESIIEFNKSGNNFSVVLLDKKDKDSFLDHLFTNTIYKDLPQEAKTSQYNRDVYHTSNVALKDTWLSLGKYDATPLTDEEIAILKRLANEFGQAYTRFLDLQKAEAQAREAQIQLALERVRARTMAMHSSNELTEVTTLLFQQISSLGIKTWTTGFNVWSDDNNSWVDYVTNPDGGFLEPYTIDATQYPINEVSKAKKRGEEFFVRCEEGEKLAETYRQLSKFGEKQYKAIQDKGFQFPTKQYEHFVFGSKVSLMFITYEPVPEVHDIFKRFGKVFEQTYTRFLDLQKAEVQAREAQIEASLERVRGKAMAMHNSNDVSAAASMVFTELRKLGIDPIRCGVGLLNKETVKAQLYSATSSAGGDSLSLVGWVQLENHPVLEKIYESWIQQKDYYPELTGTQLESYYKNLLAGLSLPTVPNFQTGEKQYGHFFPFSVGCLYAWSDRHYNESEIKILKRFATIIDLTFRRFLDLKKAEAQAREAQIETALEKVRSRSLAMHHSNELEQVVASLFDRYVELGLSFDGAFVFLFQKEKRNIQHWIATSHLPAPVRIDLPYDKEIENNDIVKDLWHAIENQDHVLNKTYSGETKNDYFRYVWKYNEEKIPESIRQIHIEKDWTECLVAEKNSIIGFDSWSGQFTSNEDFQILRRFAKVFEQAFTRFLDLQKAEVQTREAQIEAALERVRGKAMAMHNSQDLADTIGVFYHELQSFSLTPRRCGVGLLSKEDRICELFTWNTTEQGESLELVGRLKMEGHPVLNKIYESWLTQTEYHPVLRGDEITEYYKIVKPQIAFPDYRQDVVQFGYFFFFPEGGVYAWTEKEIQQDELQIYRRFTSVLSLTYKRYRDLQKAEGNAKEAVKQSVLDRIRADIASMRTVTDLDRITPLIWNELAVLGIPFIRCGVFIMDEKQEMIHTFLSTPDGKAIAAFQLAYTTPGNISEIIKHWRKKEIYCDHWDEDTFREFANGLEKHGEFTSSKDYVSTLPPGGFYLHFVPFLQGMLYVGNTTPLGERDKQLIQSIADAFSTAYARYEDFNKLEEAKKQVDKTLLELQATQKQLIQSEKMASLGELTAGIAHEIQNPLNFVNNFSDVNKELLEELKEEIKRGNFDEVKSIANDVIENEQKINHHGKRADAIVKGMLQHSRKSSGQKEPTDINALADEYLRLSYHGLRAKDKAFNAQFITDFDESVGKIDVVPQDIGRVLLNLFNNAFYAVNERQKGESAKMNADYKPLVSVETKKLKDKIEIKISDNGNGIPQKIMDKIYQPFFTTKPTGEGTGLGLSLSYDIIKATGGEIKMETKEGEGTEFSIELPIK